MGNWTGRWKSTPAVLCKCECGKENGAEKCYQIMRHKTAFLCDCGDAF